MGSSITNPYVQACLGSKRNGSDLQDGADEPPPKRSRSIDSTAPQADTNNIVDTDITSSIEIDATLPDAGPENTENQDSAALKADTNDIVDTDIAGSSEIDATLPKADPENTENQDSAALKADTSHIVDTDINSSIVIDADPPDASLENECTRDASASSAVLNDGQGAAGGIPSPSAALEAAVTGESSTSSAVLNDKVDRLTNDMVDSDMPLEPGWRDEYMLRDEGPNWNYHDVNQSEDDAIDHAWGKYVALVASYAGLSTPKTFSWDKLSLQNQAEISKWAANAPDHFNSANKYELRNIFLAWVHHILYELVFSGHCQDKWNGELWKAFGTIQAAAGKSVTDSDDTYNPLFHHWRNLTTRLISRQDANKRHLDTSWLKEEIQKRLGGYQAECFKDTDLLGELEPFGLPICLRDLINAVVSLDTVMITARRRIRMAMCHPDTHEVNGFDFDREKMGLSSAPLPLGMQRGTVDYIQRPALVVYGDCEGRRYYTGTKSVLYPVGCDYGIRHHYQFKEMMVVRHHYPKEPQETAPVPATQDATADIADANE